MKPLSKVVQFIIYMYFVLFGLAVAATACFSVFTTVYFKQYEQNDLYVFVPENVPLLLLLLAVIAALFVYRYSKKTIFHPAKSFCVLAVFIFAFSLFLIFSIQGLPTNDAKMLNDVVNEFMQGDYSSIGGGYLSTYPFQIGYVMFGQWIYMLFGPDNYLVYQLLNVAAIIASMYFLYKITWEMFEDDGICDTMILLAFGAWFFYVYSTFIYNDVWSMPFQIAAIYLSIRFLKTEKLTQAVGAAILLAVAVLLKNNCYIAVIAVAAMLVFAPIRHRTGWKKVLKGIVIAGCTALLSVALSNGVMSYYVHKAGLEKAPDGVPAMAYFAMGMQEMEGKYGWYDGYNAGIYHQAEGDGALASEVAKENIKERIEFFKENKKSFVKFYLYKYMSQWADPTEISLRELEETGRHVENQPAMAEVLIFGVGYRLMSQVMNVYHAIIYLGTTVYVLLTVFRRKIRNINDAEALVIMFIFGGMMFHMIWEASGRYVMRYYLHMLPLAAYGVYFAGNKAAEFIRNRNKRKGE